MELLLEELQRTQWPVIRGANSNHSSRTFYVQSGWWGLMCVISRKHSFLHVANFF